MKQCSKIKSSKEQQQYNFSLSLNCALKTQSIPHKLLEMCYFLAFLRLFLHKVFILLWNLRNNLACYLFNI